MLVMGLRGSGLVKLKGCLGLVVLGLVRMFYWVLVEVVWAIDLGLC